MFKCRLQSTNNMDAHLKKVYGFNTFREYQREIISDLLEKNDVFALLPTGGGNRYSISFLLPI